MIRALAIVALAACSTDFDIPSAPGVFVGEQYCIAYSLDCGQVYEFAAVADNPLGHVELCVLDGDLDDAIAKYGPARLSTSPRFNGGNLCVWQCPSARGCNAYNSCWCGGE